MGVTKYAHVYARIRARVSDVLDEGKLRELVDARPEDFVSSLMDTAYKQKLTEAGLVEVDARSIEVALKAELIVQYVMVLRSTKAPLRDIFEELLRRLEVKNLKAILRAKATTARARSAEELMIFPVEDVFKRGISRLNEATSVEDVINHLDSPYFEVLKKVLPEYEETKRLLILENALDEEICEAIWSKLGKLKGKDKKMVKRLVGTELDSENIMTVLRCKAEGIPEEELREYLLPYSYGIDFSATALNDSIAAEDVSAAIRLMPDSAYKGVLIQALPLFESEQSLTHFEDALWRHFYISVKETMKGYPINIGTIIGFLYLKELEIRNLCTIAVCKENEVPAEEISKLVLST